MLIKIKSEDGRLHFDSNGDTLPTLMENFDELFVSNNSITFDCEGVDCSIKAVSNVLSCVFTKNSFSTRFECDDIHITIEPEHITVYGYLDGNIVQVKLV